MSPEIIIPEIQSGQTVSHPADLPILSVVANDPDSENFWCLWRVLGEVFPGDTCDKKPGEPLIYTTFRLDGFSSEDLVGTRVLATLWDEESGTEAVVTFEIVESEGDFQ